MVRTVTRSHCRAGCDLPQDDPDKTDRAAEAHTRKTGHPTVTITEPAR